MKQIILLSDTHHTLDERFFPYFKIADEIWHAGDIGSLSVIEKLRDFAPLRAVWGNIDSNEIKSRFKEILNFKCENMNVMMTHIGGYPPKYNNKTLPIIKQVKPDLFISGHSHILKVMYDKKYNLLHMNPGAIGNYGIHQVKTIISFKIDLKKIKHLKIIEFLRKTI